MASFIITVSFIITARENSVWWYSDRDTVEGAFKEINAKLSFSTQHSSQTGSWCWMACHPNSNPGLAQCALLNEWCIIGGMQGIPRIRFAPSLAFSAVDTIVPKTHSSTSPMWKGSSPSFIFLGCPSSPRTRSCETGQLLIDPSPRAIGHEYQDIAWCHGFFSSKWLKWTGKACPGFFRVSPRCSRHYAAWVAQHVTKGPAWMACWTAYVRFCFMESNKKWLYLQVL